MSSARDEPNRLLRLEQIISQTTGLAAAEHGRVDAARVHLSSVREDRIRRLTDELSGDPGGELTQTDAIALRLLLDEYTTAVAHLRAVASIAAARVDRAARPMRDAHRALHQHSKRAGARAPLASVKSSKQR